MTLNSIYIIIIIRFIIKSYSLDNLHSVRTNTVHVGVSSYEMASLQVVLANLSVDESAVEFTCCHGLN
jgi:hypothetical protein